MTETQDSAHRKPFLQDTTRLPFAFGLMTGLAILSTTGFFIVLAQTDGKTKTTTTTPTAAAPTGADTTGTTLTQVTLPTVADGDHIKGKADAKVTFIEFSDLQCPFCKTFHPTVNRILTEYKDDVRVVYKHFPLDSIHPQARPAALAAECAAEQGKFFEFVDAAFENQSLLTADFYTTTAKNLGLKEAQFKDCFDSQKYASRVDSDYSQGSAAGVNGTPSSFVNGTPINGALPYEQVKSIVDAAIASAS